MKQTKKIILASKSPRRRELLNAIGVNYICETPNADEITLGEKDVTEVVSYNALTKARSLKKEDIAVIGADTMVYIEGMGLGKPKDEKEVRKCLYILTWGK